MDPASAARLFQIDQAIHHVENAKLEQQQILAAFLEHVPAADPQIVANRIQEIQDGIQTLEEQRKALLRERESQILSVASSIRGGNN